ncbi:MAG: hypothetical protein ACFFAU_05735 [Candidatus Hodarchaeota archaeon]
MVEHSHEPKYLKQELVELLSNYNNKIEYLTASATPLSSIATSSSILTFISLQLFLNGSQTEIRILAGCNIILLLTIVFTSLITQLMIYRAKLRFARVNFELAEGVTDKIEDKSVHKEVHSRLIHLSHLANKAVRTIDLIQWLNIHVFFRLFYIFLTFCVSLLILLIFTEIPFRL